ncbi:MAG: hypothetical protein M3355_08600 [Actinomycetota bacterium]|nr:hypothetical protein [Actinomycetota bacterium]
MTRARAIAAYLRRRGPTPLPILMEEFERRGYTVPGFVHALAHGLEIGLLEAGVDWTVRAAR